MNRFELEERLVDFSVMIIKLTKELSNDYTGKHLSGQIIRSGSSVALNYGEAQSGESRKDFVHKMKISLKELRETLVCLKIIKRAELCGSAQNVDVALKECNELVSIFVKSVETAQKNMRS